MWDLIVSVHGHYLSFYFSYLDHRYPEGSAFIPRLVTPGSMPQGGARGQNLEHL